MSAKRLKQPKIQGSFQSTSFKIWSASNKPNMPREKYLTNTHKSYPFVFFTPFNPIVYSPIRTRTPFWKGVFLGAIRKNGTHTRFPSHPLHSPKQHQLMGQSWRNHWNQSPARLGEALHPEVQRGVHGTSNEFWMSFRQVMLNKDLQNLYPRHLNW